MEYPYKETGRRILNLRLNQGLTREKLAEMSDISVQFLSDIERGKKNMTVTTLRKLAAALMVTTDYIVNGTNSISGECENDLLTLCRAVPQEKQNHVAKLIRVFLEAINS